MAAYKLPNFSDEIAWAIYGRSNSFLVKGRTQDGTQFSRDPLNILNINARTVAGFSNSKAVGIAGNKDGSITVTRKTLNKQHLPAKSVNKLVFGKLKSNRKVYKAVANLTAKSEYRHDLNRYSVQRASAVRRSQKAKKADPAPKLRSKRSKQAAAEKKE